jgi:outer membrane protein assembly factor BamB
MTNQWTRRIGYRFAVLLAALVIAGCGGGSDSDSEEQPTATSAPSTAAAVATTATAPLAGGVDLNAYPSVQTATAAALPPGSPVPMLGANPARTNQQPGPGPAGLPTVLWSAEQAYSMKPMIGIGTTEGQVLVADDLVYSLVGGKVVALDRATGALRQQFAAEYEVTGVNSLTIAGDLVFFAGSEQLEDFASTGFVYAFDRATGATRWKYSFDRDPNDLGYATQCFSLVAAAETVWFTCSEGRLIAADLATGTISWRRDLDEQSFTDLENAVAAAADGVVYVVQVSGQLTAVNGATGATIWVTEPTWGQRPMVVGDVVVMTGLHELIGVDRANGSVLWSFRVPDPDDVGNRQAVAANQDTVIVDRDHGWVFAYDVKTGNERWRFDSGDIRAYRPAIAGTTIYLAVKNESGWFLSARDIETGLEIWRLSLEREIASTITVSGGVIYFASDLFQVIAVGASDAG